MDKINSVPILRTYLDEGGTVIMDDVIGEERLRSYFEEFKNVYGFLLLPGYMQPTHQDMLKTF